jgi:hypothetical protein
MKALICALLLALPASATAQEKGKEKWQRVYTYDDGFIEMDTSKVTFGSAKIGRVRFRTVFSKPEALKGAPGVKYKSRLETIEFKCAEKSYRIYEVTLLNPQGKPVQSYEREVTEEWKAVKFGSMMEKLFAPACNLIEEKRRNP